MFRKVLLWFGGMLIFSFVAFLFTSTYLSPASRMREDFFRKTTSFQVAEAERMYEHGGPQALHDYLDALNEHFGAVHHLLSPIGTDLVDGTDRSELVRNRSPRPTFFRRNRGPAVIVRPTADRKYQFVVEVPMFGSPLQDLRVYGWIVLVVVLLCYVLAWRLARPIRRLHEAVVQFGHGDLSARSNLKRRDELGDLSKAFDQMADRIQTLLTAERRLLQDISHELRSPLTRLRFAVELGRATASSQAPFDRITREVDRLSTLVDELLQVTRAEGDPGSRNAALIDLPAFLESLVEDCRIEAESRGSTLQLTVLEPVRWTGDRELLHRAVENVVRNAIRYTEPGTAVEVELSQQPGEVVIRVRDHGPGVPEEALPKLFQPFYRVEADRNREHGGVGLGLAIADRAIRLHHGDIQARNVHPGLLVELKLPQAQS